MRRARVFYGVEVSLNLFSFCDPKIFKCHLHNKINSFVALLMCVCKIRLAVLGLQNASFDCGNSSKGIIYLLTKRKVRKCVLNVLIVADAYNFTCVPFQKCGIVYSNINSLVHAFCIMFVLNG